MSSKRPFRVTAGAVAADGLLSALLPPVEALADASVGEAPEVEPLPKEGNPYETDFASRKPLVHLMPMESVRRIDRGELVAARVALLRQLKLNAYLLRGQTLIDRLVGELLTRRLAHEAFRLGETQGGIDSAEARTAGVDINRKVKRQWRWVQCITKGVCVGRI